LHGFEMSSLSILNKIAIVFATNAGFRLNLKQLVV